MPDDLRFQAWSDNWVNVRSRAPIYIWSLPIVIIRQNTDQSTEESNNSSIKRDGVILVTFQSSRTEPSQTHLIVRVGSVVTKKCVLTLLKIGLIYNENDFFWIRQIRKAKSLRLWTNIRVSTEGKHSNIILRNVMLGSISWLGLGNTFCRPNGHYPAYHGEPPRPTSTHRFRTHETLSP